MNVKRGKLFNTHIPWLDENLGSLGGGAYAISEDRPVGPAIRLHSTAQADNRFELPLTLPGGSALPFAWMYTEDWLEEQHRMSLARLSVYFLLPRSKHARQEFLALHWDTCGGQPYQPHWHAHFLSEGNSLHRIHLCMNPTWDCCVPESYQDYRAFLTGLIAFMKREFARGL